MLSSNTHYEESFSEVQQADNVDCVTLKLKPAIWDPKCGILFQADFIAYCSKRRIEYCLYQETGDHGNVHYHGIMGFPCAKAKKCFQTWFNKYYGHFHVSVKFPGDGWYRYCTKGQPIIRPLSPDYCDHKGLYLFDPYKDMAFTTYIHANETTWTPEGPPPSEKDPES